MNKTRETLRLILTTDMSNRMIGRSVGISHTTVNRYRGILMERGLDWLTIHDLNDFEIESLIKSNLYRVKKKRMPDWAAIYQEMQLPHVTLQLLWEEYCLDNPDDAYGYSQFTYHYREFVRKLDITMRQSHKAGDAVFVDFAGRCIPYQPIGEPERNANIFVGVMGCSKETFAHACASQKSVFWIDAHNRMYHFFGGVPTITVPDNLKPAVIRPGAEPQLNRAYLDMAVHYGTVIVPARVRRPQDKSLAEIGVQIVTRWIIAPLRHRKFFSLEEINEAIAERLVILNQKPFKKLPGCRQELFEQLDKPRLLPLPATTYEPTAEWTAAQKVRSDYHIYVDKHYYSVPYHLVGAHVEVRMTHNTIEVFSLGKRVATHVRRHEVGGHTTLTEHQPISHRKYAEQTPEFFRAWADEVGESTVRFVEHQLTRTPSYLPGLRVCSSLKNLSNKYGVKRLEKACARAAQIGSLTLKSVKSILRRNLDAIDDPNIQVQGQLPLHYNVRGPEYYSEEV
jgi:transposase